MEEKSYGLYFPIMLDLSKFNVLVIGGGDVATRKVFNLLEFNCKVTLIAPEISKDIQILVNNDDINWIKKKFEKVDINNFNLVFASTGDDEVDEMIAQECEEKGVLLNIADVPALCSFIMPATIKRGDLTLSIGSQGRAPFYVKHLRKELSEEYPEITADQVELASLLRDKMIEYGIYYDKEIRNKLFDNFFKLDFIEIINEQGMPEAKASVLRLLNKYL